MVFIAKPVYPPTRIPQDRFQSHRRDIWRLGELERDKGNAAGVEQWGWRAVIARAYSTSEPSRVQRLLSLGAYLPAYLYTYVHA